MTPFDTSSMLPRLTGEAFARALTKAGYHCVPLSPRRVRMERGTTRVHIPIGGVPLEEIELRILLVAARISEQELCALLEQDEAFVVP